MRVTLLLYVFSLVTPSLSIGNDINMLSKDNNRIPYYITESAKYWKIDPKLLKAVCYVESRCTPTAINNNDGTKRQKELGIQSKSHGMFQMKLATARGLGFEGPASDLLIPGVSSFYAAKLLRRLYDKYGSTVKVISSYNAGKYVTHNTWYVKRVMASYIGVKDATDTKLRNNKRSIISTRSSRF